jgi:Flp pilus assembly protein TadB
MYKRFPGMGKGAKYTPEYQEDVTFLGWNLRPEEFSAAVKGTMVLTILIGGMLAVILGFVFAEPITKALGVEGFVSIVYLFFPVIIVAVVLANYVQGFPKAEAQREKIRALTYVPEMIGYMIMSMKLVPNLEKAVEFSAEHGKGRIAQEFRRIMWNTQLGIYTTVAEGLDDLAYKWGRFSSEFKQALMNIRASVLENTEAKRYQLLDKTMDEMLESVQNKMEQYARDLSQPSTTLFYVGVLLPLILIIILPVGSAFSGSPLAQTWVLFLIYDIALPIMVIWFGNNLLQSRPPTYTPPEIPDGFPGLPPKNTAYVGKSLVNVWVVVAGILLVGAGASAYLHFFGLGVGTPGESNALYLLEPDKTLDKVLDADRKPLDWFESGGTREAQLVAQGVTTEEAQNIVVTEKARFFAQAENDVTPYNLIFGILITASIAIAVYIDLSLRAKRKMQQKFMQMESEFKDSLYVLASRLGENKPIEDALRHAQTFLPNNIVSQEVFGKTVDNIHMLGMPLENAVFDPAYGSLRNNPSQMITSSMKIAIDSVKLGVGVAARTLISLSRQLGNAERVSKMLTILIKDITGTMKTVSVYIAPIVLGITTSLQRIVIVTLVSVSASGQDSAGTDPNLGANIPGVDSFGSTDIGSFIKPDVIATLATPGEFLLIVAIYVIELVIIMNYFVTLIEDNNKLTAKQNAGASLPIAVILFVVTVIVSNTMVAGNFG